MISDDTKMIVSLTEQISLIVKETVDDFIIETIEPYCSEVAEVKISKEELKKIILKHYGIPNQESCEDCIKIPEGATNGDMIKALFPNISVYEHGNGATYSINNEYNFNSTWWNSLYRKEQE